MSILISIFISGYHGKTTNFAQNSSCHRTTIAHCCERTENAQYMTDKEWFWDLKTVIITSHSEQGRKYT